MSETKHATKPFDIEGMPPGIPYIVGNEAAERFSFYGMRTILVVFMTKYLMDSDGQLDVVDEAKAKEWFHLFVSAAYFFPLLGAIVADWFWGKYRTIMFLSIVYCFGHLALAMDETRTGLLIGLILISIGTGAIKPCVSAHVGDQFGKRNKHLISRVFGWFYVAINLGAVVSSWLTPILLNEEKFYEIFGESLKGVSWISPGPALAFGVPGVLMAIATVVFWMGRKKFVHIPARGKEFLKESFTGDGLGVILRLLPLYACIAIFWCVFDQTGSAWVLQATHMDRNLFGMEWLESQLQLINPAMILILVPVFAYLIYPYLERRFGITALGKISVGLFLAVLSWCLSSWIEMRIDAGETPNIIWQVFSYAILTASEVMVSITCLEFSYMQAPNSMKSVIMSIYLLSVTAGNLVTAGVNRFIQNEDGTSKLPGADYYWFFTGLMFMAAIASIFVAKTYKGKTYIQDEDAPTAHEVEMEADAEGTEH
jgi:POT family proton-dependent oligopeptide transporter